MNLDGHCFKMLTASRYIAIHGRYAYILVGALSLGKSMDGVVPRRDRVRTPHRRGDWTLLDLGGNTQPGNQAIYPWLHTSSDIRIVGTGVIVESVCSQYGNLSNAME